MAGHRPKLTDMTDSLRHSMGAYIGALILNEINWAVTRAEGLNVQTFQKENSLEWDPGCENGYDSHGICGGYFFDGTDTYSIVDPLNMKDGKSKELQKLIGGDNPLTTGKLLFTSGLQCSQTCGKNGGCAPTQDPADPSSVSCLSGVRVCTYTWDTYGPFKEGCDNLPAKDAALSRFGVTPCKGEDHGMSVPKTYLGGGILKHAPGDWADRLICNSDY
ncbi:hypothetical protein N7492_009174 [Penicillium capsulatum]|uniref:Uncharacterized protein n=1 Tax=Penicillium capsulatum TaxID=69766 RepID=A0A9W9LGL8_9EURO|nr:hypothetical protein N7492_009174 [Penicillium capsulatum]KAJ6106572.1 hypothetical protein N7512_010089 [Penicillium capsulatum]